MAVENGESKTEGSAEMPGLVVDDPEQTSQQKRINQILASRKWVKETVRDIHLSNLTDEEKDEAVFEVVRWYVSDLEPLKQHYPSFGGYWTGESGIGESDQPIGSINYERRARRKREAIRRHEMSGVRYSVSTKGIELVEIQPQSAEIRGLDNFINLNSHEEVLIAYQKEPSPFDKDPEVKQTQMQVVVPSEISNRAFRLANLYISEIGITAEPGEEETDAVGRYSDLMEHGPPEGDMASVRDEEGEGQGE